MVQGYCWSRSSSANCKFYIRLRGTVERSEQSLYVELTEKDFHQGLHAQQLINITLTYSCVKSMRFCRSMSSRYARMLLLMNRLSWSLIQSLKTNARTPVVSSKKKMIPRNTENCSGTREQNTGWFTCSSFAILLHRCTVQSGGLERTNLSRNVFSRSAPMHPAKPRMNMTPPTTMNSQTGSSPPRSVMDEMLDRTPWRGETEHNNTVSLRRAAASRSKRSQWR